MSKAARVSRLVPVVVAAVVVMGVVGWGLWAYPAFEQQHARATAFFSDSRNFKAAYGTDDVQVGSVVAKASAIQQFAPPEFQFQVSVNATVDGLPKRDGSAFIGHSAGQPSGTFAFTTIMWPADLAAH